MAFEGQEYAYGSGKQRVIFWKSLARSLSLPDGGWTGVLLRREPPRWICSPFSLPIPPSMHHVTHCRSPT
jgi:hypothetical protein